MSWQSKWRFRDFDPVMEPIQRKRAIRYAFRKIANMREQVYGNSRTTRRVRQLLNVYGNPYNIKRLPPTNYMPPELKGPITWWQLRNRKAIGDGPVSRRV